MSAEPAQLAPDTDDAAPVVRLSYQSYDEVKPPAKPFSFAPIVKGLKVFSVLALMLAYPVLVALSHDLNDRPVSLEDGRHWAAPDIGVAATLITRELDGPGWTTDKHRWHPQARLTALPAWQASMIDAIADHGRMSIDLFEGQRDPDMATAMRLLGRSDGTDTTSRLIAAREAMTRYDGRVAVGLAGRAEGQKALQAELTLMMGWAETEHQVLSELASPGDGWIASTEAVTAVYTAKAKAHVGHEMLAARLDREPSLVLTPEVDAALSDALTKWRTAAAVRPLFVSNQGGDALIGANHPAMLAFLLEDAVRASETALQILSTSTPDVTASADIELP